ncbi:MAG: hypothetical protein MJE12_03880 [Alphaproteobacteria bacterium]|nr:hypothetical protein [Alphaproteobacteria bacterium]
MKKGPSKFDAGAVTFVVRHELWDGNIQDHPDQGVAIMVQGPVNGSDTTLLRFNCFDVERSYIYAPEGKSKKCWIDPIVDGNPIGWSVKQLRSKLPQMLTVAGYETIAAEVDTQRVSKTLDAVEAAARDAFMNGRNTVKHNRGTDMFEAGNIRFGLEMRELNGDGGLAIHVLSDLAGTPNAPYAEETEILAFDCFRDAAHYHYGPRNKNHRVYWDRTLVPDPLEWTLDVLKARKLREMIAAAGYPGVAADVDEDLIAAQIPAIEARAREMQPKAAE